MTETNIEMSYARKITHIECCNMNYGPDGLFNGRRNCALTEMHNFSFECLATTIDYGLRGNDVVAMMEHSRATRGVYMRNR